MIGKSNRCLSAIAVAIASILVACNDATAPTPTATTLYFFANYQNPNVTVSVNGSAVGQITKQYATSTECGTLLTKNAADGVLSIPVRLGQHYSIAWTYSSGATDTDSLTVDSDIVSSTCLIEPIDAPPSS